ncbi:low affinity potassium transport system protein kup [Sphingomonas changbaiensis NBRC 104936]|uniref:Probable potassium transport system protein Kup n=1 Tax=Sphingomonas changbaiensis NBRC 104936 TaxID=1219043 RepID=A0A0E9MTP0_9SPHN|nr:potassium transporter Kup [Sphingomonas changbaiensis]GAO40919.1 low affinity potassium transport system protein kup [Sphingomonas changbaiensis NBRC 104936]
MHGSGAPSSRAQTAALTIGAIGVVFGDIGTSPLYAFREALAQSAGGGIDRSEILGVLSLALWALILVVTVKYVTFLLRADNNGEGGVLSLMALAKRARSGPAPIVFALGAAGAALFYGDATITPALSVLSAVEGLKTVPGLGGMDVRLILGLTVAILVALFAIQSHGTARVARLFGPVCIVWFLAIGGLGLLHIADTPAVLFALNPLYGISFLTGHGVTGLFVLGAVFLTVTGAEALTADMGHFGRRPIRIGWFALVFPALSLNYLGQGAYALAAQEAAQRSGQVFQNADWFFLMAPDAFRAPLVILATLATIIASQAVITGAYSLTQQAIALGLLPRLSIQQTSEHHSGQIYLPVVNWLLLAGVLILVDGFRSSSAMAAAYGIAVTGTMVITTCLAFIVVRRLWKWRLPLALALIAPMLALDLVFFGANILRVSEGGWVPLLIAALLGVVIVTWVKGRALLAAQVHGDTVPLDSLVPALAARPPREVEGTAVFLASDASVTPAALLHNLKHNKVLHRHNIVLKVATAPRPHTQPGERLKLERLDDRFARATLTYGYMETPDVPADLLRDGQVASDPGGTSFFISRNSVGAARKAGMPFWQDIIFIFLQKNASDPTQFFRIPPNRVVELGTRIEV